MIQPVRVAVIGCGWAGRYVHLTPLRAAGAAATLAWVVDAGPVQAAAAAQEFGALQYGTSLDAVLADRAVDAVIIATPTALHAPHTLAAVRAGKHVLVEKPMASSAAEARAMDAAARAAGVVLMVAHCCRFLPAFVEARRLIATGRIGRLLQIQSRRNVHISDKRIKPWWPHERPDGFLLSWLGSHIVDLTIWLLDSIPKRVAAEFGHSRPHLAGDAAFALLMWFEPGVIVAIEQSMDARDPEHDYLIIGSAGTLRIRDYVALTLDGEPVDLDMDGSPGVPLTSHSCYPPQQQEFFAAIHEHRTPAISGSDGIMTMEVIDACYRAGRSHTVETLAAGTTASVRGMDNPTGPMSSRRAEDA